MHSIREPTKRGRPARALAKSSPAISRHHRVWLLDLASLAPLGSANNLPHVINLATALPITGIILSKGLARANYPKHRQSTPLIIQLTGQPVIEDYQPTYAPLVCTVQEARELSASAINYQLYLGSSHEQTALQQASQTIKEAKKHKLSTILTITQPQDSSHPNMLAYAAQVASQLKADYVQLSLPADSHLYHQITSSAADTQVLINLSTATDPQLIEATKSIVTTSAAGIVTNQATLDLPPKTTTRLSHLLFGIE